MSTYKSEWSNFMKFPEGADIVRLEMEKLLQEEAEAKLAEIEQIEKEHMGVRKPDPVPIHLKVALTINEAAAYSNIGTHKLNSMLKSPRCPFVLYVGTKKLVKRVEFEKYLASAVEI